VKRTQKHHHISVAMSIPSTQILVSVIPHLREEGILEEIADSKVRAEKIQDKPEIFLLEVLKNYR
jgi:hypothetical protein